VSELVIRSNFPICQTIDFWNLCKQHFPQEYDWLVSLVRAFREKKADCIYIDDRRKRFQIQATAFAKNLKLLSFDEKGSDEQQYTAWEYRLTELGKRVLLDVNAPSDYCA